MSQVDHGVQQKDLLLPPPTGGPTPLTEDASEDGGYHAMQSVFCTRLFTLYVHSNPSLSCVIFPPKRATSSFFFQVAILLLFSLLALAITLLIMHILNPDKEPLPWRAYCSVPSLAPPFDRPATPDLPHIYPNTTTGQLSPSFPPPNAPSFSFLKTTLSSSPTSSISPTFPPTPPVCVHG